MIVHILANDDGSNALATEAEIQTAVDYINGFYLQCRIQVDHVFHQINSTFWRQVTGSQIRQMKEATAFQPERYLNVWIIPNGVEVGWATLPWDAAALTPQGGIFLPQKWWTGNYVTVAHEIGHCLGLYHTFTGVAEVYAACDPCYEAVDGKERDLVGDFCADTPPSPKWYQCSNAGGIDSCSGLPWGETQPENMMAYTMGTVVPYNQCQNLFTPQQRARARCWFNSALTTWTSGVVLPLDTLFGVAPFQVEMTGKTHRQVDSWLWDLGDQSTATSQNMVHTYDRGGVYSVGVEITTPDGVFSDFRPNMIWVPADTVTVSNAEISPGEPTQVEVSISNYVPMSHIILPVAWTADRGLRLDSISTIGLRGAVFDTQILLDIDNTQCRAAIQLEATFRGESPLLEPGRGPVVILCFSITSGPTGPSTVSITPFGDLEPFFACPMGAYSPVLEDGIVFNNGCCVGRVGDANGSGEDMPTIGDVSVMIDAKFITGTCEGIIGCLAEADANLSGGVNPSCEDISIGDISMLIDCLFITGEPPFERNECAQ